MTCMRTHDTDTMVGTFNSPGNVGAFLDLDVGRTAHHGQGPTPARKDMETPPPSGGPVGPRRADGSRTPHVACVVLTVAFESQRRM